MSEIGEYTVLIPDYKALFQQYLAAAKGETRFLTAKKPDLESRACDCVALYDIALQSITSVEELKEFQLAFHETSKKIADERRKVSPLDYE